MLPFLSAREQVFFVLNEERRKISISRVEKSRNFFSCKKPKRHERKTNVISVRGHVLNIQLMSVDYIQLLMSCFSHLNRDVDQMKKY
jgi:hypothetical protein